MRLPRFQFRLRTIFVVVTFLSLYLGSYLNMRQPVVVWDKILGDLPLAAHRELDYRFARPFCRFFFAPAAWLEKKARPDYWGPDCMEEY